MYEAYFGLKAKPFQISTNPDFMWLGEKHREALATLKYGILDSKGFLLLTGDVGTGKTTLLHALLNTLDDDILWAVVPNPGLDKLDFFNFIARGFRLKKNNFATKGAFLDAFGVFLRAAHKARKRVLLIVDEAQAIEPAMLEEIRLLSNIEKQYTTGFQSLSINCRLYNPSYQRDTKSSLILPQPPLAPSIMLHFPVALPRAYIGKAKVKLLNILIVPQIGSSTIKDNPPILHNVPMLYHR